jgi:hypothetical protein
MTLDDRTFIDVSTEDWSITPSGSIRTKDGTEAVHKAALRAVVTPYGWIGRWAMDDGEIAFFDGDYGDHIYEELSEPLTQSWLSQARADVARALSYVEPDATLINIEGEYQSLSGVPDGAIIHVTYQVEGIQNTLEVSL